MLEAAMQRPYSAAPETFFTGGGSHSLRQFRALGGLHRADCPEAFENSINLAFVRMLRDVVNYYTAATAIEVKRLLADPDDPQREDYLQRFVDTDSRRFLYRFYRDYKGMNADEAIELLAGRIAAAPRKLAAVYMTSIRSARIADLYNFLSAHLPQTHSARSSSGTLFLTYSPEQDVAGRPRLCRRRASAGVVAGALPAAPSRGVVGRGARSQRAGPAGGLFLAAQGQPRAQNTRIRILLEQDAFDRLYENWRSLGFPFGQLVPSLGTAIGASGDRPDALAELMGIMSTAASACRPPRSSSYASPPTRPTRPFSPSSQPSG